jgi:transglutaminase-like putative cysteine protease
VKALLLLLYVWTPLRQETNLEVFVTCRTPEIFRDYRNYNFKQEIRPVNDGLKVRLKSRTLNLQNLNHVIRTDERYLSAQGPGIGRVFGQVSKNALSVAEYLNNISLFIKNQIEYTEADLPQEVEAVLGQRKAHCIGFANIAQTLLACVGISSRPVNGFYLREKEGRVEPVPHRWLEIDLPGSRQVFYDPQYQDFSSRYLVINVGLSLERIERFAGVIIKKSKKIVDE